MSFVLQKRHQGLEAMYNHNQCNSPTLIGDFTILKKTKINTSTGKAYLARPVQQHNSIFNAKNLFDSGQILLGFA